jgi:hypothetical protein
MATSPEHTGLTRNTLEEMKLNVGAPDMLRERMAIEDFLNAEADLLDQWRLDEWLALFAPERATRCHQPTHEKRRPQRARFSTSRTTS